MQLSDHSYSEYSEIGPIPPPRMFSDSVLTNFTEQFINASNANDSSKNYNETNDSTMDSVVGVEVSDGSTRSLPPINHFKQNSLEIAHNSSLPMCLVRSQLVNEPTSVVEEVPTKEPQLSAVPKKSALKKPRITGNDSESNLSSTQNLMAQTSTSGATHSTPNTSTPSPMMARPQPSPRYVYNCVQQTPMQIVVTASQHNSHLTSSQNNGSVDYRFTHLFH